MSIEINLTTGESTAFAALTVQNIDEERQYRAQIRPMMNQALSGLYVAEWMGLSAMGRSLPSINTSMAAGIGGARSEIAEAVKAGKIPAWILTLYEIQLRSCRAQAREGGYATPQKWMPLFDPTANLAGAGYIRSGATIPPALVVAGVVGVAAALAFAVAWWTRGRDEAEAGVRGATIKTTAASNAAARIALGYVAAGKDPPKELIEQISALGNGESARAWAVPFAVAAPIAIVGGVAAHELLK